LLGANYLSIGKYFYFDLPPVPLTLPAVASPRKNRRNSSAVEDYLERILELIDSKGYARVVDIAKGLTISQASVTNMVQRLDAEGLLKYEKYRGLVLTPAGETLARNITRRHQLLTDFLSLLQLDENVIHHDVEGMEHHISPSTLRAIESLTAQLKRRPALLAKLAN
jgi:Mn-dependent DtxR family transcriptional regulator